MIKYLKIRYWSSYIFGFLLVILGILNICLVAIVPGILYILVASIYLPYTYNIISNRLSIKVSSVIKVVMGVLLVWGTLGVSDLFEIFESYF